MRPVSATTPAFPSQAMALEDMAPVHDSRASSKPIAHALRDVQPSSMWPFATAPRWDPADAGRPGNSGFAPIFTIMPSAPPAPIGMAPQPIAPIQNVAPSQAVIAPEPAQARTRDPDSEPTRRQKLWKRFGGLRLAKFIVAQGALLGLMIVFPKLAPIFMVPVALFFVMYACL